MFIETKLTETVTKTKVLCKALRSFRLPSKSSFCKARTLKTKNTVEQVNSVLGFRNYYSTLVENLVTMLPKPTK